MASALVAAVVLPGCNSHGATSRNNQIPDREPPELSALRQRAFAALRIGEYSQAIQFYQAGYRKAKDSGNVRFALRFLNNVGVVEYHIFRYRDAVQVFLEARDLATSRGEMETLGALDVNLSSLYLDMGDYDAALESADRGLKLPPKVTAKFRAQLLLQCARIKEEKKEWPQAIALREEAVEASREQLDSVSEAQAWTELGNSLLAQGRLSGAEHALLEGYRLRKLNHDDRLFHSYQSLGELRMRQGDPQAACAFFDRAVEAAPMVNPSALWSIYYDRGKAKLAQGKLDEAFTDFGNALRSTRRWRAQVLPADAFRVGTEVELHDVYSSYIELGSRLFAETGRKDFAEEVFTAAEENRAASLRALWAGPDLSQRLPNEYWETLARLFQAEAALIKGAHDTDLKTVRSLRLRAAELETRAGLDFPVEPEDNGGPKTDLLEQTRRALGPEEVFLGFHLGATESFLWTVSHDAFELHRLPPQAQLASLVTPFTKALRENSPQAAQLGRQLYSALFGGVNPRMLEKPLWVLAPDGPLFEVPFAALVENAPSPAERPVYVVEHHAIKIVPGISALFRKTGPGADGAVVGLGDPIYNRADPRLPHTPSQKSAAAAEAAPHSAAHPMELARLVGSEREIEDYASIWRAHGQQPILLTGASANRHQLMLALQHNPSVLHIAAHVLFPPQLSGAGLIALALQPSGEVELLSATEIGAMRINLGLVVLDGCSSARGETLPGAGLMGMTRAWLAAGAHAVIVTRWATSDQQDGELFRSFYNRLSSLRQSPQQPSFAQILQQAQIDELRAAGYRANPVHWAAYFCVERY